MWMATNLDSSYTFFLPSSFFCFIFTQRTLKKDGPNNGVGEGFLFLFFFFFDRLFVPQFQHAFLRFCFLASIPRFFFFFHPSSLVLLLKVFFPFLSSIQKTIMESFLHCMYE